MKMIGCVEPRELSDDEKQLYSDTMSTAQPVIAESTKRNFGPHGSVRDFRRAFAKNEVDVTAAERRAMDSIREIEYPVLQGYCRLVPKVVKPFFFQERGRKNGIVFDDYVQEGLCAISDSMYVYNGEYEFTTYATTAVRRRMIDYVRKDNSLSPIKRRIVQLLVEIKAAMQETGKSFEQIAATMSLSSDDIKECRDAMTPVTNGPDEKWEEFVSPYKFTEIEDEFNIDVEQVRRAMQMAPLSPFERDTLEIVMQGGTRTEAAERHHKSRMAGTLAYQRALKIVKETYDQLRAA